jgi:hypothetical protein
MLMRGLYAPTIRRWAEPHFPLGERLLVMQSSDLFTNSTAAMHRVRCVCVCVEEHALVLNAGALRSLNSSI